MAVSQPHLASLFLLFLISHALSAEPTTPITALVLPITKHASTLQYITSIHQRTPPVPIDVVVDLGGPFMWVSCGSNYNSSTYRSSQCHSPLCSIAHASIGCNHCLSRPRPLCSNKNTCVVYSENVFTSKVSAGELSEDVISLQSTNGFHPTSTVSVPQLLFSCAPPTLSLGLASGAKGVAGLGPGKIGLPAQLAAAFNFSRKFAMCLSPSSNGDGLIFFGKGPYVLLPGIDISKILTFTPLITRPSRLSHSYGYYIGVTSILVNGKQLHLNSKISTKISTVTPYTIIETSLYGSLSKVFVEEALAANATRMEPVAPFDLCFSTRTSTTDVAMRPAMPIIDLVLQDERVFWRIIETNSMVPVGNDTACLGFLDGGRNTSTSIIIGGYQLEDNLLQFDLVSSRLGFTSSLLFRETNCASFNFTSGA